MSTLLKFVGGMLDGQVSEVNLPGSLVAAGPAGPTTVALPGGLTATLAVQGPADTLTMEFPAGTAFEEAVGQGQVRLIAEKVAPKSHQKIVRYRNAGNGTWQYVEP